MNCWISNVRICFVLTNVSPCGVLFRARWSKLWVFSWNSRSRRLLRYRGHSLCGFLFVATTGSKCNGWLLTLRGLLSTRRPKLLKKKNVGAIAGSYLSWIRNWHGSYTSLYPRGQHLGRQVAQYGSARQCLWKKANLYSDDWIFICSEVAAGRTLMHWLEAYARLTVYTAFCKGNSWRVLKNVKCGQIHCNSIILTVHLTTICLKFQNPGWPMEVGPFSLLVRRCGTIFLKTSEHWTLWSLLNLS